jgi:hypothetical protein
MIGKIGMELAFVDLLMSGLKGGHFSGCPPFYTSKNI